VEFRHFGVRFFGILDTGSSKGQELLHPESRNPKTRKPKNILRLRDDPKSLSPFWHFGISGFGISEVLRTRNQGHFALKPLKLRNMMYCWSGATISYFGHFSISGFSISGILKTRSGAQSVESFKVMKCEIPSELGCGHGGCNCIDWNSGISSFQHSGDQESKELDARVCEIMKPKISFFEKRLWSCLEAMCR
jgi:hypothetical protein